VFGGRASGPAPLNDLFNFAVATFKKAAGRRLTTLECHDIVCKIAEIVVVGGVRRSALISLSDLSDDRMRHAKSGDWWKENVQRALANNSYVGKEKPEPGIFMREWLSLYESRSGERGIFSRTASKKQAEKYGRRDPDHDFGTNPCSEIILRSREFCNLTEVVVRGDDTPETLRRKVKLATILGTFQSTLTNFKYLSKKWSENCAEERLLGVSLTGIMDNEFTNGKTIEVKLPDLLEGLREEAVKTNKLWAAKLGIPVSAAITCVKPSGTVSQLVDSASGIHARHSPYYIRTVRADKKDPLAVMMKEMGFPVEDDVTKPDHTYVFSFPQKSPEHAVFRKDMSAIEQLELWLTYQRHWCEHKPSITVSVKEEEWMSVGAWVYEHFDEMSGVSFLPFSDHVYKQAPYQDCTKEEYEALASKMPKIVNWMDLAKYEKQDTTTGTQELACVAGGCEI
jgi:ribonucleoside-diphosphate reductase alpha chain